MKTAQAHNKPLVGYYKFTAREPKNLAAADALMKLFGLIRIPSWRLKALQTPPGQVVYQPHRRASRSPRKYHS